MWERAPLFVRGGTGGVGSNSFHKYAVRRGGGFYLDGGSGGRGGNVTLKSTGKVSDFSGLPHSVVAGDGGTGRPKWKRGRCGRDETVLVPLGTVVHLCIGFVPRFTAPIRITTKGVVCPEQESLEECAALRLSQRQFGPAGTQIDTKPTIARFTDIRKRNIAQLLMENDVFIAALGGVGSAGCSSLRLPPVTGKRAYEPPVLGERPPGDPGTEALLLLELKTLADVTLVGLEGAGKTTLLATLSAGKPSIARFSFSTLRPSVGQIKYHGREEALTVADLPSSSGRHPARTLGDDCLRLADRSGSLVYVLDASVQLSGFRAWEQLERMQQEMEDFKTGLTQKPCVLVANKVDKPGTSAIVEELRKRVKVPVYTTCAILEEGLEELKAALVEAVES